MKIQVKRTARKGNYTVGKVSIDGKYFATRWRTPTAGPPR